MKNEICLSLLLIACLSLAYPANADIEDDWIGATATGLTTFSPSDAQVVFDFDPEFTGQSIVDGGNVVFDVSFIFSADTLVLYTSHSYSGATLTIPDFTVVFTDLDDLDFPIYTLQDVTSISDDFEPNGEGLFVDFTHDSLTLEFAGFQIPETREIKLSLVFGEEGSSGSVVPVPAAAPMALLGLVGIAMARRFRRAKN